MRRNIFHHLLICTLLWFTNGAQAFPFVYLSDYETATNGEEIPWAETDSIIGDIYTNDCLFCSDSSPAISGRIFMGCDHSLCDLGSNPIFTSSPVHTPPDYLYYVRRGAAMQGNFFGSGSSNGHRQYVASIRGNCVRVWYDEEGVPFDSLTWHSLAVQVYSWGYIFFDGSLRISGELSGGDLAIGCSGDLWIDDNVIVEGTNLENAELPPDANSVIALATEGSIFIRNTWANGRANSAQGSDVVVTAVLISNSEEGGLRLDQPNDPDDCYICPCSPDLRGVFRLTGALVQHRRGQWLNSNNGGTGYRVVLKYDERLLVHGIIFNDFLGPFIEPDTVYFGEVVVGESLQEIISIYGYSSFSYNSLLASFPFSAPPSFQYTDSVSIPITFAPPRAQFYSGFFCFYLNGEYHEIPLRGRGINPPEAQGMAVSVHPNPFNSVTSLSLNLPTGGELNITLYDLLGREVERLHFDNMLAGQQLIRLDMSQYASGVYFAHLQCAEHTATHKLLLLK